MIHGAWCVRNEGAFWAELLAFFFLDKVAWLKYAEAFSHQHGCF